MHIHGLDQVEIHPVLSNICFILEFHFQRKRTRQTYTRYQTFELEKEFHYSK